MSTATGTKAAPIAETSREIPRNESTTEQIRQRAYDIYVSRAGAPGDEVQDWLQADRELRSKQSLIGNPLETGSAIGRNR